MEQRIIQNIQYMSGRIPGTQEIRTHIGQVTFAAEVLYGASIFGTISLSERHGTLMIRLSRFRRNDPALVHARASSAEASSSDHPSLAETQSASFQVPEYAVRRHI